MRTLCVRIFDCKSTPNTIEMHISERFFRIFSSMQSNSVSAYRFIGNFLCIFRIAYEYRLHGL